MIEMHGVEKWFGSFQALNNINLTVRAGEKIVLCGPSGSGKSTLIRLVGGVEVPTSGTIEQTMSVSWPIGWSGGVHPILTGNDNIRFVARIYNKPFDYIRAYVDDFAELGKFLSEPLRTYSTGMRARFAFALSLAVDLDCYLIDEIIAAGDQRFQRRSHEELFEKRADRSMILASHIGDIVRAYCSRALVLHRGRGKVFDDLNLALDIYDGL